ncbi:MAG TPA: tape measure protein [Burkholderiaceae bacterium]|nr:tape measure protein [Burkholderiaceae bacterium]
MADGTRVGGLYYDVTMETAQMVRASKQARDELGRFVAGTKQADTALGGLERKFSQIVSAIQVYAAAMAVLKIAQVADDVRLLSARVEVAAGSVELGNQAMRELVAISQRTRSAVSDNATVFARLNQSILQLGGTQKDTLQLTELLGQAITVSGASAAEKSAAMIQFAQAIGSGKLAGDELRSLLENAPYLMRQLADGLKVPIGALKQMGEEGKLTSDVVIKALGGAAAQIEADFKKMPQTLDSALTVAADSLRRLTAATDEQTGKNLILTGVVKGFGEAVDLVTSQVAQMTEKQDALGKSTVIEEWKTRAVTAFSYVLDAGDGIVRLFQRVGLVIYGAAMTAHYAATGGFTEARNQLAEMSDELDKLATKPLAGERIRQQAAALAAGTDGSDRLDRLASGRGIGGNGPLRAIGGGKKDTFDDASYLAGLEKQAAERFEKIDAVEKEALARNKTLLDQGKISRATYERAITLIQEAAANDRRDLALKEAEDTRERIEKLGKEAAEQEAKSAKARGEILLATTFDAEKAIAIVRDEAMREAEDGYRRGALTFEEAEAQKVKAALGAADQFRALEAQRSATRIDTLGLRASQGGVSDQLALIDAELQQRLTANEEARRKDIENAQLYADREVEIIADAERKKVAARFAADQLALQSASATFGSLAQMAQAFGGESDRTSRVLFAVSKAFAIADAIVKIQQGVASALALPYPANIAAAAGVAAQGASIVGIIKGTTMGGGRQYGGPAVAGSLYRVNETGRPEMFTAANGSQYMLPTANGNVTPADKLGGSVQWRIEVNNSVSGAQVIPQVDNETRTVRLAVVEAANQIAERRGEMWRAMQTTNVRGQQ